MFYLPASRGDKGVPTTRERATALLLSKGEDFARRSKGHYIWPYISRRSNIYRT